MLVSDARHAAQVVARDGEPRFYDDRGCLAKDAPGLAPGARLYVQADTGGVWLQADRAHFAFPAGARTPMGYGVTAFRTPEEAASADRDGRAYTWAEIVSLVGRKDEE